jgi:hypothetical protein
MVDRKPKFKKGDTVINLQNNKRTILQNPIITTVNTMVNGRLSRKDSFEGEYKCFWHDDNGETVYGTILEEYFEKAI